MSTRRRGGLRAPNVCARFSRAKFPLVKGRGNEWPSSCGLVLLLLILVSVLLVGTWIHIRRGGIVTVVSVQLARWCTSPLGVVPAGLGEGVGLCHDVAKLPKVCLFISLFYLLGRICFTLVSRVRFWVF